MTDSSKTLIAALLDRSGSMSTSKVATEKGFNAMMKDQAQQDGQAYVTLAQFDGGLGFGGGLGGIYTTSINPINHDPAPNQVPEFLYRFQDITTVPKLSLWPRGNTPLLDAIGNFVTEIGRDLSRMRESDRPGTVICLIMTDGLENASRHWTSDRVRQLITQQEQGYKWQFMFMGSNIDAVEVGRSYGFVHDNAITYNDDSANAVASAFASSSNTISGLRSGDLSMASYTTEDRVRAMVDEEEVEASSGSK